MKKPEKINVRHIVTQSIFEHMVKAELTLLLDKIESHRCELRFPYHNVEIDKLYITILKGYLELYLQVKEGFFH